MSKLSIFNFENQKIRVVIDDSNEPWFILMDICPIINVKNPSKAKQSVDPEDVSNFKLYSNGSPALTVNESGLYTLVLRCNDAIKPGTKAYTFRKWVTKEVLPQIRKTGSFGQQQLSLPQAKVYPRRITLWESEGLTDTAQGIALKYFGHISEKAHDAILMRLKYEADANDLADMSQEQFDNAFRFLLKLQPEAKKLGDYCQMQEEDFIKRNVKGLALA